jgi:hypothetical protein
MAKNLRSEKGRILALGLKVPPGNFFFLTSFKHRELADIATKQLVLLEPALISL